MTLAGSRRPQELEELDNEKTANIGAVKLKVNLKSVFMDLMVKWYKYDLSEEKRRELTKKLVIRKAISVAADLKFPYRNLPEAWLRDFYYKHDCEFKFRSKKKRHRKAKVQPQIIKKSKFDEKTKFIDLTDEPPPPEWLEVYMKNKRMWPRILKTFTNSEGVTIVYYDYNREVEPKEWMDDCEKVQPHDRDGVWGKSVIL